MHSVQKKLLKFFGNCRTNDCVVLKIDSFRSFNVNAALPLVEILILSFIKFCD